MFTHENLVGARMKVLGIETATLAGGVALMDEVSLIAECRLNVEVRHSERLLPAVDHLLAQGQTALSDLAAIAVSGGPGSYTGLRVGLAAAKGLAMGAGLPLVMIPTLEALAAAFPYCMGLVAPILDARRGQVYWALFDTRQGAPARVTPDTLSTLQAALDEMGRHAERLGRTVLVCGDGKFNAQIVQSATVPVLFPSRALAHPSAACVAECGLDRLKNGETVSPEAATPTYLRPFLAVP